MRTGLTKHFATLPQFVMLLLAASANVIAQTPQKCDVNGDGQINLTDLNLIVATRNTPVTGPTDPRDADSNGSIDVLDLRRCQLRCTQAGCTLAPANTAPVAANDSYSKPENTTLVVMAPGVLANDTDAQGNPLTAAVAAGPANGTLVLSKNGSFSYMPAPNFAGTATFTYRANDGALNSNIATGTIHVTPVDDGPVTAPDSYSTAAATPLTVAAPGVLGNDDDYVSNPDGNSLSTLLVSGPASGTLVFNADGSFTFAPAAGFTGAATFSYRVSDGARLSSVTLVTINVTPANGVPVANADAYGTDEDMPLNVAAPGVLANDTDPDGGALLAVLAAPPASGTLVLLADGSFTYTPAANFAGPASFTYRAFDGLLSSDPVTVSLTVLPVNNAPVAANDNYSTPLNSPLTVAGPGLLANDTDQLGNGLTSVAVTMPAHGTLSLDPKGGFIYSPTSNFTGADSFTYRANGGALTSNAATVTINVNNAAGACVLAAPKVLSGASNVTQPIDLGIGSVQLLSNTGSVGSGFTPIVEFTASVVAPGSLEESPVGWTLLACGTRASARAESGEAVTYVVKGQKICFDVPLGATAAFNTLRVAYYDTTLARWVTFRNSVVDASAVCHSSFRLLPSTYALFGANRFR